MSNTQSHLMKTTRRGRPFIKDTHDLFSTLAISLPFETHRNFFKSYPNSFTTDEAAANLASLKFSQSNRNPDPKDPSRIITTTTTTTFSMSREMAKGICQHFLDAHLIENATDLSSTQFRDRGLYMLTPKGMHILERFITKNGILAEQIMRLYAQQPIAMKLLHMERRISDDEIIITKSVVEVLFRRFVGREPNVVGLRLSEDDIEAQLRSRWFAKTTVAPGEEIDPANGILLRQNPPVGEKKSPSGAVLDEYTFSAVVAVNWLLDFSTAVGSDEASECLAQFVGYGFITLHSDKSKNKEGNYVATVRAGGAGGGLGGIMQEAEFRVSDKAIYRVTKEGMQTARWELPGLLDPDASISRPNLHSHDSGNSSSKIPPARSSLSTDDHSVTRTIITSRPSMQERLRSEFDGSPPGDRENHPKDSHTSRLKHILEEPALRSLFREFLRANFCEENLSFWLDLQDLKRRFAVTSSAVAAIPPVGKPNRTIGHQAMEKHQTELIGMAFVIYDTYLAPASPSELNIDHALRAELISYMTQVTKDQEAVKQGKVEPGRGGSNQASQLQTIIKLYEKIQVHVFRLMATDSVPKFCKTERFLGLMQSVFDYTDKSLDADISDLRVTVGGMTLREGEASPPRAYITISQAANEKQANLEREREKERELARRMA